MAVAQLIVRNHWQGKKRTITQSLGVVPASSPRTSALIPESIPESRRMAFVRIMKLHFRSLKRGSCRILSLFSVWYAAAFLGRDKPSPAYKKRGSFHCRLLAFESSLIVYPLNRPHQINVEIWSSKELYQLLVAAGASCRSNIVQRKMRCVHLKCFRHLVYNRPRVLVTYV